MAAKPSRSRVFLDNLDPVRAVPSISTWPEIEDVAGVFLEEAMYEQGELPSEIARQLDQKAQEPFARAER